MASSRSDWILFLLARYGEIDAIRLMKALFLAQTESPEGDTRALSGPFRFVPYSYGPFDRSLYADLEGLEALGLVVGLRSPRRSYGTWRLSDDGVSQAAAVDLPGDERARLDRAVSILTEHPGFDELLRFVYARHPASARNSVHRAARDAAR